MKNNLHSGKQIKKKKVYIEGDNDHEEDMRAMEDKDLAEMLPWNLWWTRLDKLSAFNPMQMFQYYFVPHTTGPSISYLLFSLLCIGLYVAILLQRRLDDKFFENTWMIFEEKSTDGQEAYVFPEETGYRLQSTSAFDSTDVIYVWESCTAQPTLLKSGIRTFGNFFHITSCKPVATKTCVFSNKGDDAAVDVNCPNEQTTLFGVANRNYEGTVTFLRFRLYISSNSSLPTSTLTLQYRAMTANAFVDNPDDESMEDIAFRTTQAMSFPLSIDQTTQVRFIYEANNLEVLGRYLVTKEAYSFLRYNRRSVEIVTARPSSQVGNYLLFESLYSLDTRMRKIFQRENVFVDIIAKICALIVVLWAIGAIFRFYNRWHFLKFGRFQSAELPEYYTDSLFDPNIPFSTPGLKELIALKNDPRKRLTRKMVQTAYKDIKNIRELLISALEEKKETR